MSDQLTLWDTPNATSSPVSADGATPSVSPAGPTTGRCGPEAAPASPSAPPASRPEPKTTATSGPSSTGSSASADLTQYLANRLQQRLASTGSTMFRQTWKRKVTPSGRSYWAHTASVPRTSGSGYGSWPSPKANNTTGAGTRGEGGENLQTAVTLASWPTPSARDWRSNEASEEHHQKRLEQTRGKPLNEQAHQLSGPPPNGSPAETENPGQLNPAFSLWLQGYPAEWVCYAERVTQLSRRLRRK
jgi:site-specific DNA-cytosine methylase